MTGSEWKFGYRMREHRGIRGRAYKVDAFYVAIVRGKPLALSGSLDDCETQASRWINRKLEWEESE